jgi:hypothetical protein
MLFAIREVVLEIQNNFMPCWNHLPLANRDDISKQ